MLWKRIYVSTEPISPIFKFDLKDAITFRVQGNVLSKLVENYYCDRVQCTQTDRTTGAFLVSSEHIPSQLTYATLLWQTHKTLRLCSTDLNIVFLIRFLMFFLGF